MPDDRIWQATEARAHLPSVMEAANAGKPQIIRKRSGEEFVLLSRADYERMRPTVKEFLLASAGAAGADDDASFEAALRGTRGWSAPRRKRRAKRK